MTTTPDQEAAVEAIARAIVEFWGEDPDRVTTTGRLMWEATTPLAALTMAAHLEVLEKQGLVVRSKEPRTVLEKQLVCLGFTPGCGMQHEPIEAACREGTCIGITDTLEKIAVLNAAAPKETP